MSRNRLLAVSGVSPWPLRGGFSLRAAHLLERLANDWEISLIVGAPLDRQVCPLDERKGHQVVSVPIDLPWRSVPRSRRDLAPLSRAVDEALQRTGPRAALLFNGTEFLAFGRKDFPRVVADRIDCGALERLRYVRRAQLLRWPKTLLESANEARYERRTVRETDATVVAGEDDRRALEWISGRRVHLVPNGVVASDTPGFEHESRWPTVVFTGTLSYYANVDAALHMGRTLWPRIRSRVHDARLVIAGRNPSRRVLALGNIDGVEIRANVPHMEDVLREAWVAVAPMRCGAGVKNKVLEAWGCGRPAVLTPLAANGLKLDTTLKELVEHSPDRFSDRVAELLGDPALRHRHGLHALEWAQEKHPWTASADALSRLLEEPADQLR